MKTHKQPPWLFSAKSFEAARRCNFFLKGKKIIILSYFLSYSKTPRISTHLENCCIGSRTPASSEAEMRVRSRSSVAVHVRDNWTAIGVLRAAQFKWTILIREWRLHAREVSSRIGCRQCLANALTDRRIGVDAVLHVFDILTEQMWKIADAVVAWSTPCTPLPLYSPGNPRCSHTPVSKEARGSAN